jgi:hypothetical protein
MIELKMSSEEAVALNEVLTSYLSDLRMEISATDIKDFRDRLKEKEKLLENILSQVPRAPEDKA